MQSLYRLFALMCLGRWENRFDHLWLRLKGVLLYAFAQRRVVSEKFGLNHFLIFWGFMALLAINAEFMIAGVFPRFSLSFLGPLPYGVLLLAADLMSLVVLVAVAVAVTRRLAFRPPYIEATADAFIILSLIATLMVAYYGLNACRIELKQAEAAAWMPVSRLLSAVPAGWPPERVQLAARGFWWIHALALLAFLVYLPRGKHLHIITAIPNCFFRSLTPARTVPRLEFVKGRSFGVSKVFQFSWKGLLDLYSCHRVAAAARRRVRRTTRASRSIRGW